MLPSKIGRERLKVVASQPKLPIVAPDYMERFECIGTKCEDTCCKGWSLISVDGATQEKYRKVKDPELKSLLDQKIVSDSSTEAAGCPAKILLNEDTSCPFHNMDGLCSIQLKLGEDHLSSTCKMYPRLTRSILGVYERVAVFSCPEIVRLALLNPEGITFTVQEIPEWPEYVYEASFEGVEGENQSYLFWHQMREVAISIIQDRTQPLGKRLFAIGQMIDKLERAKHLKSAVMRSRILEDYRWKPFSQIDEMPGLSKVNMTAQAELLRQFLAERVGEYKQHRYNECKEEVQTALKVHEKGLPNRYKSAYKSYLQPFHRAHPYILENFLAHNLFHNFFCPGEYPSLMDAYGAIVVRYALIRGHLTGMGKFNRNLDAEIVVRCVQSFSKACEHSSSAWNVLMQRFRREKTLNMEFLGKLCAE